MEGQRFSFNIWANDQNGSDSVFLQNTFTRLICFFVSNSIEFVKTNCLSV